MKKNVKNIKSKVLKHLIYKYCKKALGYNTNQVIKF